MRLQPTFNLLGIKFNTQTAQEIMQEKVSTVTRLLYQVFISLTNKEKRNLTGTVLETIRPAAPVRLEQLESKIYHQVYKNEKRVSSVNICYFYLKFFKNLTSKTPRQTKLNLEALRARYDKFKVEQDQIAMQMKMMEQQRERDYQQQKRAYLLNRSKEYKQKQSELLEKIR